jgi:hypothetical protein
MAVGVESGRQFGEELLGLISFRQRGVFALLLPFEGGETVEKQLADVGLSDGVAAVDTFAGDLLEEVAEIAIDGGGGGEIFDATEEFGGECFVRLRSFGVALSEMVGAERVVALGNERAAMVAAGVDVTTEKIRVIFRGHGSAFPILK